MLDGQSHTQAAASVNNASMIDDESSFLIAVYRGLCEDLDMELRVDVFQFAKERGLSNKQALRAIEEAQARIEERPYAWDSSPEDVHEDDIDAAYETLVKLADEFLESQRIPPGCSVWFDGLFKRWRWTRPYDDKESTRGILSSTHGCSGSKHEAIQECKNSYIKSKQAI